MRPVVHSLLRSHLRRSARRHFAPRVLHSTMSDSDVLQALRAQIDASRGAIFDNDGTLVDTMPSHFRAWHAAAKLHGLHFSEEEFYARAGATGAEIVAALNAAQGKSAVAADVLAAKSKFLSEEIASVGAIDVVVELAKYAKSRGIPVAVASGGRRANVVASLRAIGIDAHDFFGAVITAEDVRRGKPHPETFLTAARRIGADPERCIGFEDGELGLQALRSAGMKGVDVRELPGYPLPALLKNKK